MYIEDFLDALDLTIKLPINMINEEKYYKEALEQD